MHARSHGWHTAIVMAAAEVLAGVRQDLRGTIKLLFRPAEENLPQGEIGGANPSYSPHSSDSETGMVQPSGII